MNDPALRVWLKPQLKDRTNWGFEYLVDWEPRAQRIAWNWEVERELGSGNGCFEMAWKIARSEAFIERAKDEGLPQGQYEEIRASYFNLDDTVKPPHLKEKSAVIFQGFSDLQPTYGEHMKEWRYLHTGPGHTFLHAVEIVTVQVNGTVTKAQ